MKLIIQRVTSASVQASGKTVGQINQGLFVLVGFKKGDEQSQVDTLANKLIKLRVMSDENDKMNKSILDGDCGLLVVSQFSLYANTKDGNRPSFIDAEQPDKAKELYNYFVEKLKSLGAKVQTGSFGKYMKIDSSLDGPVTIILEA